MKPICPVFLQVELLSSAFKNYVANLLDQDQVPAAKPGDLIWIQYVWHSWKKLRNYFEINRPVN